ncbi:hypothetical protein [Massilia glaciei]|uniref:Uncharacterized protein n=1 Tax=Massilia glaciei TaxID=1524097 RepID=A0A2U2HK72_9BURK|nr:hypothetical protein [Massilia glaciei]PWF47864.1 hypothetical protein C7C56_013445 [Massilia glaciei]
MNILKNMELVFIVALALTAVTAIAASPSAPARAPVAAPAVEVIDTEMMTVVVSAKRMTPAQKAAPDA